MKNEFKDKTKDIYFLENGHELKIVAKTIPHAQIVIKNDEGTLKISEESFDKNKRTY